MNTYQLVYSDDGRGVPRKIEFDAKDAAAALSIACAEAPERSAELWHNDEKLCTIRRSDDGFWQVAA